MRQLVIVPALLLCAAGAAAQGGNPVQSAGRGYFGAPVLRYTVLNGQAVAMFGGRGAWNLSPSLQFGAGAYGTASAVDAPAGSVPDAPGPLDIAFETFGFDVEYAPRSGAPTHLTAGVFLGGGAGHHVRDGTREQHGETDFMLLVEPSAGVEQRLVSWFHLNLAVSYRMVRGVEMVGLETGDFAGPGAALAFKLGRF